MATVDRQRYALQTIFSFFLGLMVVAFIGIGVNTFYPSPEGKIQKEQQQIDRKMQEIDSKYQFGGKAEPQFSDADRAERARLMRQQNALQDKMQTLLEPWMRNTSIILIIAATAVMSTSLYRSDQLRVVSNGLLLGGLFTMIYGAGWSIFAPGTSAARFYVVLFALVVTIALGYVKFVMGRKEAAEAAAGGGAAAGGDLEARVAALEARLGALTEALTGGKGA